MYPSYKSYQWWKDEKNKSYESVFPYVKHLTNSQGYRDADNLRNMRLYGNFDMSGLQAYQYAVADQSYNTTNRVTLNIVQSVIDTVVSKMTKSRPRATFLTDGGDYSLQSKAKKLTKFVEGQFYASNYYQNIEMAFQDACIFGTGFVKLFRDDKQIKCERVLPSEIIIDDSESFYGSPRQMHQVKYIHRDVLKEMFPDSESYIDAANRGEQYLSSDRPTDEMIKVIESWHLPSGKNAKDGKHAICIENHTLWEDEYKKTYFPFIAVRWNVRPLGYFGQGLSEQLTGLQLEINKILKTIQISMHLTSIPKVFVEASSKVVTAHLNNKIGGVIKYVGTKPSYESVSAIPQDLFLHLDRLYNKAFEIAGVSQLAAQSKKPSGLDSGRALREFSDIESERFMSVGKRYQESFMEAAKMFVDMSRDIYAEEGELTVAVKGDKFLETINWSEIDLEEDQYMMHVFPTSSLSSTPSGKLQDVQELIQAGMIDPQYGMKLLDFPDLATYENRANAHIADLEWTIEQIVEKSKYLSPEPYQDLQLGIKMMQQSYLFYRSRNLSDDKLELMRRWMEEAQELVIRAATPAEPMLAEAPVDQGALAVPEALPTSDILPQA
jgi:hypothetical protein